MLDHGPDAAAYCVDFRSCIVETRPCSSAWTGVFSTPACVARPVARSSRRRSSPAHRRSGRRAALETCLAKWALWEIDPATMAARELFRHDGEVLCGATAAAFVRDRYLIGSMSETRVGVWRDGAAPP